MCLYKLADTTRNLKIGKTENLVSTQTNFLSIYFLSTSKHQLDIM